MLFFSSLSWINFIPSNICALFEKTITILFTFFIVIAIIELLLRLSFIFFSDNMLFYCDQSIIDGQQLNKKKQKQTVSGPRRISRNKRSEQNVIS